MILPPNDKPPLPRNRPRCVWGVPLAGIVYVVGTVEAAWAFGVALEAGWTGWTWAILAAWLLLSGQVKRME